ncbi:hypothetical protein CsSME_00005785 [Camellia sinensis var. sinensis]
MQSSIRPDIITFVHTNMSKHSRQPYAVSQVPSEPCVAAAACSLRQRSGDRWHRRITVNQNRYAASAVPSLVMARGHRIESVPAISLFPIIFVCPLDSSSHTPHARNKRTWL